MTITKKRSLPGYEVPLALTVFVSPQEILCLLGVAPYLIIVIKERSHHWNATFLTFPNQLLQVILQKDMPMSSRVHISK